MTAIEIPSDAFIGTHPIATTKYGMGGDASMIQSAHLRWDATFVGTITFWSCDFPPGDVLITSAIAGDWIQQNPTTGYTPISPAGAATAVAPLTIIVPGGTAGGAAPDIGNLGHKRLAAQVACTVAGFLRIRANGKE